MSNFFFQRYVDGRRMADDVLITKQQTLEAAIPEALRLCRNSPKSVLVYVPEDSALREENSRLLAANKDLHLHFDVMYENLKKANEENARLMELIVSERVTAQGCKHVAAAL